jgi:hypothetical protein
VLEEIESAHKFARKNLCVFFPRGYKKNPSRLSKAEPDHIKLDCDEDICSHTHTSLFFQMTMRQLNFMANHSSGCVLNLGHEFKVVE